MRASETLTALLGVFGRRLWERARAGWSSVRQRRPRKARVSGPLDENPLAVMGFALAAAVVCVALFDPHVGSLVGGASGHWRGFLKTLTALGEGVEILVGSAAILVICLAVSPDGLTRRIRAALFEIGCAAAFSFVAVAGSGLAASLIKNTIGRARPGHVVGPDIFELHPFAFQARHAAFPSGHATTAGASAMVLALLFPSLRKPVLAVGVTVAVTRILLEAHFPSDVVAGFGVGAACTLALAHGLERRGLVFRRGAAGRLEPKAIDRPGRWPDVLAALLARARGG